MSGFQTLGDFLGSFGAASLEPANELVEAGRGDEHIDDFETELLGTLLDASGTLQVDLKNGGDAFGEVFLNGLEGRAVAGQAVDRGGFEKIAGLFLVGELLVVEEPVVDTIDLAGPRLAGGGGHGDPDAGMVLAQDVLDGSLAHTGGAGEDDEALARCAIIVGSGRWLGRGLLQ